MIELKDLLEFLRSSTLSLIDLEILLVVEAYGSNVPREEIRKQIQSPESTLSSALKRLRTKGFIVREDDLDDVRKCNYTITEEGRRKLPSV